MPAPGDESGQRVHPEDPAEGAPDVPDDDASDRADRDPDAGDPDAPGNFVDDETSDEVPEPNEPA
jgi:hypothetical protein